MLIKFKRTHHNAKLPSHSRHGDIGLDLCCVEDFSLNPGQTLGVRTGLQVADLEAEDGGSSVFLKIESRSGLALKGVFTLGGIIDTNYRGELTVILHNGNTQPSTVLTHGQMRGFLYTPDNQVESIKFKAGDRIAQLLVYKVVGNTDTNKVTVVETNEVTETNRGASGFGSSGA